MRTKFINFNEPVGMEKSCIVMQVVSSDTLKDDLEWRTARNQRLAF